MWTSIAASDRKPGARSVSSRTKGSKDSEERTVVDPSRVQVDGAVSLAFGRKRLHEVRVVRLGGPVQLVLRRSETPTARFGVHVLPPVSGSISLEPSCK